jgi:hypothetical protein
MRKASTGPEPAPQKRVDDSLSPRAEQIRRALDVLRQARVVDTVMTATETAIAVGVSGQTVWNWRHHIGAEGHDPHIDRRWVSLRRLRVFLAAHWRGAMPPGVAAALAVFDGDPSRLALTLVGDVVEQKHTESPTEPARARRAR